MTTIEGLEIMDNETILLADLIEFNEKYARYIECNNTVTNANNVLGCSANEQNKKILLSAYDKLLKTTTMTTTYSGDIQNTADVLSRTSFGLNRTEYDASFNAIKQNYNNDVLKMRSELDVKMKELYKTDDSISAESKLRLDATIYAGVLWTVLATSTLYYIFIKM